MPPHALLGSRRAQTMPLYRSITCIAPTEMARIAREAQARGDRPLVYGDWNCGATSLDASRVGWVIADLNVMLEQPCATIEDCARVRAATGLPMKLDESARDTASLLAAHGLGCMDAVAVKLSIFGRLSAARRPTGSAWASRPTAKSWVPRT